jgi:P pilus assembly chaperone PapD
MKKTTFFIIIIFFAFTGTIFPWTKNVVISPVRLVLENGVKTGTVKIVNPTEETTVYKISLTGMETDSFGKLEQTDKPDKNQSKALEMLRFSPKRAVLKPNAVQTIRLLVKNSQRPEPGEYRCHLKVTPLPPAPEKNKKKTDKPISININYLVSTSIPVIFRHGETYASVNIEKAELKNDELKLELSRTGNASALFDVKIMHKDKIIGERNKNAFYTPNKKLILPVKIKNIPENGENLIIKLENSGKEKFIYDVKSLKIK